MVVEDRQPQGSSARLGEATRVGNFSEQNRGTSNERHHALTVPSSSIFMTRQPVKLIYRDAILGGRRGRKICSPDQPMPYQWVADRRRCRVDIFQLECRRRGDRRWCGLVPVQWTHHRFSHYRCDIHGHRQRRSCDVDRAVSVIGGPASTGADVAGRTWLRHQLLRPNQSPPRSNPLGPSECVRLRSTQMLPLGQSGLPPRVDCTPARRRGWREVGTCRALAARTTKLVAGER